MADFVIDTNGVVREPHVHDALLAGIALGPGFVEFRFRNLAGAVIRVLLDGLERLSVESMSEFESNVIFEIRVLPVARGTPEDIRRVLHAAEGAVIDDQRLSRARARNLILVYLDASVGADALALCREISWESE